VQQAGNVVPLPKAPVQTEVVVASIDHKAEREEQVERIKTALAKRYIIKRTSVTLGDKTIGRNEYRFRSDTVREAFTESAFRMATDTNSPSVARSVVDVAQSRNWKALRVTGNKEFKRLVWLGASVRGVKALGYEPSPSDLDLLKKEREAKLVNRIEPVRDASAVTNKGTEAGAAKASGRGGGGRKTVLAAIEAVLVAKGVPEKQRKAVMADATEKLVQRLREGQTAQVKVYDKEAPRQQPAMAPIPAQSQRQQDRAAPVR
jgi:hypothetical protein